MNTTHSITDDMIESPTEERFVHELDECLQRAGFPPLQYLEVCDRDGHVYISARVPTLFLSRCRIDGEPVGVAKSQMRDPVE